MADRHLSTGKVVDNLVNTDLRPQGFPSIYETYEMWRTEDESMTLSTARALVDRVDEGDTVIIPNGAGIPPWHPAGETDGPFGAAGLARALAMGLGANPILTAEERNLGPLTASVRACGLPTVDFEVMQERNHAATVVPYPMDYEKGEAIAEEFLDRYDPAAVISIEKTGPNREGRYHSALGVDWTPEVAHVGPLFELAEERGVLTVGIGDLGNEIGMGHLEEELRQLQPYGETCQCPCEGGIVSHIETDHLVVSSTSNWGAYGVEAMLAYLTEKPEAMHSPDEESRMVNFAILENVTDGMSTRPTTDVDGIAEPSLRAMVQLLNNVVESRFVEINADIREFETSKEL
jgi:hypothetical protein